VLSPILQRTLSHREHRGHREGLLFYPFSLCSLCSLWQKVLAVFLLCAALLLLLAGCNREPAPQENAPRLDTFHPAEPRAPSVIERAPPQVVPPLRRTAAGPQDAGAPELLRGDSIAAVARVSQDGGVAHLHLATAPVRGSLTEELKKFGFLPQEAGSTQRSLWTRTVAADERAAFETQLLLGMEGAADRLAQLQELEMSARQPGQLVWSGAAKGRFFPGKLVYTGHPLDLALADAGDDPHSFFVVQPRTGPVSEGVYMRGGRLFVAEDWTLGLGDFKPAGEWKKVPPETTQLTVQPDGQVRASLRDGTTLELGRLQVVRLSGFMPCLGGVMARPPTPQGVTLAEGDSPLRPGHLEYGDLAQLAPGACAAYCIALRRVLAEALRALNQPAPLSVTAPPPPAGNPPIVIHADLTWTEQQLKALGVPVERTPGHTTIPLGKEPQKVADALTKVLQVLRLRMASHDENLRNADRVRDAENRLNPYRRKVIRIGPQGEAMEEADPAPFPKVFKPGDANADAEGYITLPNVNRALETAEFQAAAEEYRLVRACMERLAPQQIFPDPPAPPVKPEAR